MAVLGAGAGGAAATVDLTLRGHQVRLWNRSPATLEPFQAAGRISYQGVLGAGTVSPEAITDDLPQALKGADAVLVCLPALAHGHLARALGDAGVAAPIVLHPGHTGGALHFRNIFRQRDMQVPPLAELSTLAYVARKHAGDSVTISGVAARLRAACLPGGEEALSTACALYPASRPERDVLATDLANVNLVLHPPGAILAAAWIEATHGDFLFYAEGVTPGVAATIGALDRERLAVATAFDHHLSPLHEEMAAIGTADPTAAARGDIAAAIKQGKANAAIRAPDSLAHRYYTEDFGYGLVPLIELAHIAAVDAPVAKSLLLLGETLLGANLRSDGLNAARLGLTNYDRGQLLDLVRGMITT
ncbi:MAG TPA: NAD/NADP octopine/nopaline dehydrogenase family protein [Gaiellaceae bacterium]|nr:NAD/NADP octopine/nopaline dehydrogenase family protein [Gaiellaceae bacterium]